MFTIIRHRPVLLVCFSFCALAALHSAAADSFLRAYYDGAMNELVVAVAYQGTNPDHRFTLKWGPCQSGDSDSVSKVDVEVLDNQFLDFTQQDYQSVARFSLADLPCPRPVAVTLYTAPRRAMTLVIPE